MNPTSFSAARFNPWPVAIILYFVIFISGVVGFITFAVRQKVDLVGADYYEQEVRFQQQIDRVRRTAARTLRPGIAYEAAARSITVRLPAAHAGQGATGWVRLYRPSDATMDRSVALSVDARGEQRIDARALRAGLWKVRVLWQVAGEEFFEDQSLLIGHTSG